MPAAWRTEEFLRTYSTASLPLELELQEALPFINFKDVCKRDLKAGNVKPAGWEAVAADRSLETFGQGTQAFKERRKEHWDERAQTAEGSISTHRATHRIHQQ